MTLPLYLLSDIHRGSRVQSTIIQRFSGPSSDYVTFRKASNHFRSAQPPSQFFPFTFQRGETHAIWPQSVSPSSNDTNHSSNLSRHGTSGVRPSARCVYRSRPVNSQVSNLRSLRQDRFPAREEAACGGTHSALAKNSLIKCAAALTRSDYAINEAVLDGCVKPENKGRSDNPARTSKFPCSATNALVMLLGAPPPISPASLGGGHFYFRGIL